MEALQSDNIGDAPKQSTSPNQGESNPGEFKRIVLTRAGMDVRDMSDAAVDHHYQQHLDKRNRALKDPGGAELVKQSEAGCLVGMSPGEVDRSWLRMKGVKNVGQMSDEQVHKAVSQADAQHRVDELNLEKLREKARICELIKMSRLPELQLSELDLIDAAECQRWASQRDQFYDRINEDASFIGALIGIRGVGKTEMLTSIGRQACREFFTVQYWPAMELFLQRRAARATPFVGGSVEQKLFETLARVDVLLLDDVHERGDGADEQTFLTTIIDRRFRTKRPTFMAGNYQSAADFAGEMGPSIASRLNQRGEVCVANWPSFRIPHAWRRDSDIKRRQPSGLLKQ